MAKPYMCTSNSVYLPSVCGGGYLVVDELPMQGDVRYIYFVDNGVGGYTRYVWADGEWVSLGDTNIDLSDYLPVYV